MKLILSKFCVITVILLALSVLNNQLAADDIPLSKISFSKGMSAAEQQKAKDNKPALISKQGADSVEITCPEMKIEPQKEYKISIFYEVPEWNYGAIFNIKVQELEGSGGKRLPTVHDHHPEFRSLLPSRPGEIIPRYMKFKTTAQAQAVRIVLELKGNPFTIKLHRIAFEEAKRETADKAPYPYEKPMPMEEMLKIVASRPNAEAAVEKNSSRLNIKVNNQIINPIIHQRVYWEGEESLHRLFANAGVKIHTAPVRLGPYNFGKQGITPSVWTGPGQYNFEVADREIERALRAAPDAYLIISLSLIPYPGWGETHPDDVICNEKGEKGVGSYVHNIAYRNTLKDKAVEFWCPSLYSEVYKKETMDAIKAWMDHIKKTPYYKTIIGFNLIGGDDGQWGGWERSGNNNAGDYSPAGVKAFRAWLKRKYLTAENFQAAWSNKSLTFDNATVPPISQRFKGDSIFYDPLKERPAIDYFQFSCDEKCRTITWFAEQIKKEFGKQAIVGSYYEDGIYGRRNNLWFERERRNSPYMDFFGAPLDYGPYRQAGWAGGVSAIFSSLKLHNKLFYTELDLRTNVSRRMSDYYDNNVIGLLKTEEDFNAVNRRETGLALSLGMSQWYYCMAGGSFYSPFAMAGIKESVKIYDWAVKNGKTQFHPDVAVFVDEECAGYVSSRFFNQVIFPSTSTTRSALFLSGVPFDLYETGDLNNPELPQYKVYVFLNSYYIDAAGRNFINAKLKNSGKTLVWMHAAGYINEKRISPENISSLTGIKIKTAGRAKAEKLKVLGLRSPEPHFQALLPVQGGQYEDINSEKFIVEDPEAVILGKYEAGGENAVALKKFPEWSSVYIATPGGLGADLFSAIADYAGAYRILDKPGNMAVTNGSVLTLHGAAGGMNTVVLPFKCDVIDLVTGERKATDAKTISVKIPVKGTLIYGLVKKE